MAEHGELPEGRVTTVLAGKTPVCLSQHEGTFGALSNHCDAVISVDVGDGGFAQYMAEITTGEKYEMDVCHILLNNSELGKISKEQRAGNWDVGKTSLHNPNSSEFATSCGALGIRVTKRDEVRPALERALAHDGPAMVEVMTDAELI